MDLEQQRRETTEALRAARLVGVVRAQTEAHARALVDGLLEGGLRALEITANTPGAFKILAELNQRIRQPSVILGVGTIKTAEELASARASGARFIVSPHADPELIQSTIKGGMVSIPGAFTATEILAATKAGADFVKLFPVSAGGGAKFLRTLRGPLPEVPFWVSGNVQVEEIDAYSEAGASLIGLTSALTENLGPDTQVEARKRASEVLSYVARAQDERPLLSLSSNGRQMEIALKALRRLPGSEHAALESIVAGKRGHAVRLRMFLQHLGVPKEAQLELKSVDGFTRNLSAAAVYDGGFVQYASDGHPLERAQGGPLRLYVVGGQDQCDNVKGLCSIAVL